MARFKFLIYREGKDNTERSFCQTNPFTNLDVTFCDVLLYPIMVRSSRHHPYQ